MNYEPEVIRARFVEAAYTERFLSSAVAPTCKGYWPEFIHDTSDKEGWDDAAHLDNAAKRMGRASTGAISRHQECLDWTRTIITDEMRRHVLWSWAFCKANGWDFGARCNRKGWARPTAYRRLNASIEAISYKLRMESLFVRLPDDKWLRHETQADVPIDPQYSHSASAPAYRTPAAFISEKSTDTLTTPEAVVDFVSYLEKVNDRRRRDRVRRFDAKDCADA